MIIELPDGIEAEFPDDMPQDAIEQALRAHFASGADQPRSLLDVGREAIGKQITGARDAIYSQDPRMDIGAEWQQADFDKLSKVSRDYVNTAAPAGAAPSWLRGSVARVGLAGAAASTKGDTWQDKLEHGLQGAGLAMFMESPTAVQSIFKAGKRALYDPSKNPERVVGQTLRRMASDPENPNVLDSSIKAMENPEILVRGSMPTAPQASRNGGLWALYKSVMAREPAADRAITDSQNLARLKGFKELGVGENAAAPGLALQASAVQDLRRADDALQNHPINLQGVLDEVDGLLNSGAAKTPQIRSQLQAIRANLFKRSGAEQQMAAGESAAPYVRQKQGIDTSSDDIITAIRKLGGINKDSAQNVYGNEMWKDVQFKGHPTNGPVWRNAEQGQPLDEMAKRLHENGYLDQPDYGEMLDLLYEVSKGTHNPSRMFSKFKQDFSDEFAQAPRDDNEQLLQSLQDLIGTLSAKNAPKNVTPKELETAIEQVQGIRTAIGRSIYGENGLKVAGPVGEQMSGLAGQVTGRLDDAIEQALAESGNSGLHQAFRQKYAQGKMLEGRATTLRDLLTKGSSPGELPVIGPLEGGGYGPTGAYEPADILSAKLSNLMRGKDKTMGNARRTLTDAQMARLQNIERDIRRGIPRDVKRGSDTMQNMATDYVLADILGPVGERNTLAGGLTNMGAKAIGGMMPSMLQKLVPSANVMENEGLRAILTKAMRDPRYASALMKNAGNSGIFTQSLGARLTPSLIDQMNGQR